jgi:hypothetical protein
MLCVYFESTGTRSISPHTIMQRTIEQVRDNAPVQTRVNADGTVTATHGEGRTAYTVTFVPGKAQHARITYCGTAYVPARYSDGEYVDLGNVDAVAEVTRELATIGY